MLLEISEQTLPASSHIVFKQFNAVEAGNRPNGIVFILELGILPCLYTGLADCEFSAEYLNEKVAVSACRFQET